MTSTVAVADAIETDEEGVIAINFGTEGAVSEDSSVSDDDDTADILPLGLDLTRADQARGGN